MLNNERLPLGGRRRRQSCLIRSRPVIRDKSRASNMLGSLARLARPSSSRPVSLANSARHGCALGANVCESQARRRRWRQVILKRALPACLFCAHTHIRTFAFTGYDFAAYRRTRRGPTKVSESRRWRRGVELVRVARRHLSARALICAHKQSGRNCAAVAARACNAFHHFDLV